ncbi:hypothetical protein FACS189427_02510 [Planctomycetales bacterium]|nr:hypothetical protein FACS189427_02510 [Planctomycetales bacterium]
MPFRIVFFIFTAYLLFFAGPSAFRDGAHFYPPLFQYQFEELFAGRFPLWNPYENLGQPQAANPTSMLFYPGFYLAAVPLLFSWLTGYVSFPIVAADMMSEGYTLFLSVHLLLALWTSYRFARVWKCSRNASTVAAICYTLSGSVLFQWHNAPFLVAAALFPEAMRTVIHLLQRNQLKYAVRYAVILSLLITGGDPQSAYHSVLCAAVFFVFYFVAYRDTENLGNKSLRFPYFRAKFLLFLFSGALTFLLSAILILPAAEFSMNSDRSVPDFQDYVYWFSIPPWRLSELCFPNIGGCQFPAHTRWFDTLPENGIWTPSLYMGTLPVLLAVFGIVKQDRSAGAGAKQNTAAKRNAAKMLLAVFLLGSLGNWFFVYPAMRYLPFYDSFRYPGKLMSVATLFIALFAAIGADWVFCKDVKERKKRCALLMKIYAAAVFILTLLILSVILLPLNVPANILFGQFDKKEECFLFLHTAWSGWLFYFIVKWLTDFRKNRLNVLVLIILADLCFHNHWFFAAEKIVYQPILQNTVLGKNEQDTGMVPLRIYRYPLWEPQYFSEQSSLNRLAEITEWNKQTLFPKYTLPKRINVVDVRGTMMPKDYYLFTKELRRKLEEGNNVCTIEKELAMLGVNYVIAPEKIIFTVSRVPDGKCPADVKTGIIAHTAKRNFTVYEPNRIEFNVLLEKPETVVITEQYWNGWRAFDSNVDGGIEIPVFKAEPCFRSIILSAGEHHITMIYDPPLLKIGAVLSIIGLVIAVFCSLIFEILFTGTSARFLLSEKNLILVPFLPIIPIMIH